MKALLILILCFFSACKFRLSTYSAETPDQKLNTVNLEKIHQQESSVGSSFKIALISDTHNYYDELESLIETINRRGPYSFVIISGDISNLGLLQEYETSRDFFNRLRFPFLVSVGNHDLLANGEKIFSRMFGTNNFGFEYKGIQFVFFNNNNWESSKLAPNLKWLNQELSKSSSTEKILVAHVRPDDEERFSAKQIEDLGLLMDSQGVDYFINGHNHNPEETMVGSVQQITVGAPNKKTYFELLITPGGISHQKVSF